MVELPRITPEYFEILVVRELRKVGLEVAGVRVERRSELPEPERGFLLELGALLGHERWRSRALIGCRRQERPVGRDVVASLEVRLPEAQATAAILFSTSDFEPAALAAAQQAGIPLLRVVDGRSAFDTSGWGTPGHYPAWLPAHVAQLIERDLAGQVHYRLLEAGRPELILNQLRA